MCQINLRYLRELYLCDVRDITSRRYYLIYLVNRVGNIIYATQLRMMNSLKNYSIRNFINSDHNESLFIT